MDEQTLKHLQGREKYMEGATAGILQDILDGKLVRQEKAKKPNWSVHACFLDKECRTYGAPARVGISTPNWYLGLACTPGSRYAGFLKKKPLSGGFNLGGWITLNPSDANTCSNVVALVYETEGAKRWLVSERVCPLRLNHRGKCYDWKREERVSEPIVEEEPARKYEGLKIVR